MEITNEERREVAERLRRQARWMNKNKDWYDKDDIDQGNRGMCAMNSVLSVGFVMIVLTPNQ